MRAATMGRVLAATWFLFACGDDTGNDAQRPQADAGLDVAPDAVDAADGTELDTSDTPDLIEEELLPPVVEPDWCSGPTMQRYNPAQSDSLDLWPDHWLARPDDESPTGYRLDLAQTPWLAGTATLLRDALSSLSSRSGFATIAGAVMRFDGAIAPPPGDAEASLASETLVWLDLDTEPVERIPYEARLGDEGRDLLLWALRPLRPGHRHAIVMTRAYGDEAGDCIAPALATREMLTGTWLEDQGVANTAAWTTALTALQIAPADVSAMTVFTTHDDFGPMRAAAAAIAADEVAFVGGVTCDTPSDGIVACNTAVEVVDYRREDFVDDGGGTERYAVPVRFWLPETTDAPLPVLVAGHGLGGDRTEMSWVARMMVPAGFVVVASDAIEHGEHPAITDPSAQSALRFLGINLAGLQLDAPALRGNFEGSMLERAQLARALALTPDLDGDGTDDIDPTRIGYWGISLGGMLGAGTLALSDQIDAGVLSIAGGRLLSFATDTAQVVGFRPVLYRLIGSEALFNRLLPVAQAVVDTGDPAAWGPFVLHDRIDGRVPPHLLFPVSIHDATVPPSSGRALARALGVSHVPQVLEPVSLVVPEPSAPVSANQLDGTTTAGFFQFGDVTDGDAVVESTHNNTPGSVEARAQVLHFFSTWADTGTAEIIDPYAAD